MNPITVIKAVVGIVASVGAGAVVENAIKFTTPVAIKTVNKVMVAAGTVVLSAWIGSAASKYAEGTIDYAVAVAEEFGKAYNQKLEEKKAEQSK